MGSVSHRQIAALANVSTFTVSLALRNSPRVAAKTRNKIQAIAQKHGYTPNALISELMSKTRAAGNAKFHANVAFLDASNSRVRAHYTLQTFRDICTERARTMGYNLEVFYIDDSQVPPIQIERILSSRGIRGLLILWPTFEGPPPSWEFLWRQRSCVFIGSRPNSPVLSAVMGDHFQGGILAYQKARAAGYKRIAIVVDPRLENSSEGRFMGGIHSQHLLHHPSMPVISRVFWDDEYAPFIAWYRQLQPDCIITMKLDTFRHLQKAGIKVPQDVGLIHWDMEPSLYGLLTGPEQHPVPIARAAVDLLINQLNHGETGVATTQKCMVIEPLWREGPSLRRIPDQPHRRRGSVTRTQAKA